MEIATYLGGGVTRFCYVTVGGGIESCVTVRYRGRGGSEKGRIGATLRVNDPFDLGLSKFTHLQRIFLRFINLVS